MKSNKVRSVTIFIICSIFSLGMYAQTGTIKGVVSYYNDVNRALEGVTVILKSVDGKITYTTLTDIDGQYAFTKLPLNDYLVTAAYNRPVGKRSMADALLMQKSILGQINLTGLQKLAADIDRDGLISQKDFTTLVVNHLAQGNSLPRTWIFEEKLVSFSSLKSMETEPDGEEDTEESRTKPVRERITGIGGTTSGDVGGTFVPESKHETLEFTASTTPVEASTNQEMWLPVRLGENAGLSAMRLVLSYPSDAFEVTAVKTPFDIYHYSLNANQLTIAGITGIGNALSFKQGDVIAQIRVRINGNMEAIQDATLTPMPGSHFVNAQAEKVTTALITPKLISRANATELYANYPNPFAGQTEIAFKIGDAGHTRLEVYDMQGKMVARLLDEVKPTGYYRVDFKAANLKPGTYIYRLSTSGNLPSSLTRVMIITSR